MSAEKKLRQAAENLDEALEPMIGTSDIEQGARVGYQEDESEERLQQVAAEQGVSLQQNPDGSHTAVDESLSEDTRDDIAGGDTKTEEDPPSEPPD